MWRWWTVLVLLCLIHDPSSALQSFIREPSDQYVREGQTVVLPCQVHEAVGQVQWTRDEFGLGIIRDLPSYPRYQMIGDDHEGTFSLEIQRATMEDDAVFQCQVGSAEGQPGIRSRDARVTLLVPPEPPRIIQGNEVVTTAGMEVRLQCESRGGKPPAEIEWHRGDGNIIDANSTATETVPMADGKRSVVRSTLVLTAAAEHHDSHVTCRAHNAALSAPQTTGVSLRVTFRPEVTVSAESDTAAEFEDVRLHCAVRANPAQVRYRWFVNGELLAGERHSSVTLRAVDRRLNNATVTCQVTNSIGTGTGQARIAVLYSPRFRSEPQDVAVEAGNDATLVCDIEANPAPHIAWTRHGCPHCPKPVGVGRALSVTASAATVGQYECRTSSEHHAAISRRLRLFVRSAPRVTAPATQHGRPGQLVHLECNIASVPPPSRVVWRFRNQPVPLDVGRCAVVQEDVVGGIRSLLVIPDAEESDFGLYNCSVSNAYGTDFALIILETEDDVPIPVILTIIIGAIIIIITISLVVILCQRHHRRSKAAAKETVSFDKSSKTTDANSSGSDLKVEIRTSSSGSGQVITDRWDGPTYPGHGNVYEEKNDVRAFPPFSKDTIPGEGPGLYAPYDTNNYIQKPGPHQRVLHASTPIEFGAHSTDQPPVHPSYYPDENAACQQRYYPEQTAAASSPYVMLSGRPAQAPLLSQTGYPPAQTATSPSTAHRPSYCYSQDVSDASSSSHSRSGGSTLPYDDTVASASAGRAGYYAAAPQADSRLPPRPLEGRVLPDGTNTADRDQGRDRVRLGSMGRSRTGGRCGDPGRRSSVGYVEDGTAQLKSGNLATPV